MMHVAKALLLRALSDKACSKDNTYLCAYMEFVTERDTMLGTRVFKVLGQRTATPLSLGSDADGGLPDTDDDLDVDVTLAVPIEGMVSEKVCVCVCVCVHTHMYLDVDVKLAVRIEGMVSEKVCVCVCVCVYTHTRKHTHTHTHT